MKQPFSANNNANPAAGLQTQGQAGSFSQNQFVVNNGPEWNNARNASINGNVRHV